MGQLSHSLANEDIIGGRKRGVDGFEYCSNPRFLRGIRYMPPRGLLMTDAFVCLLQVNAALCFLLSLVNGLAMQLVDLKFYVCSSIALVFLLTTVLCAGR